MYSYNAISLVIWLIADTYRKCSFITATDATKKLDGKRLELGLYTITLMYGPIESSRFFKFCSYKCNAQQAAWKTSSCFMMSVWMNIHIYYRVLGCIESNFCTVNNIELFYQIIICTLSNMLAHLPSQATGLNDVRFSY